MAQVKGALVITPEVLEEMITDYVKKVAGKNLDGLACQLTLPDASIDEARRDLMGSAERQTLPVFVATWE